MKQEQIPANAQSHEKQVPDSTEKSEEFEAFYEIWNTIMQRILSISYIDKLASLCQIDKEKYKQANQVFQNGILNARKGFKRKLKQIAEKRKFSLILHDVSEILNFNLLIAELLAFKGMSYSEEEL